MSEVTRRSLMGGYLATALLGVLDVRRSVAAPAGDVAPEGMDRLQSIMSRNDVTVIRDLPHTEVDQTYQFLSSDKFLGAAQKAGVRTIGNEIPSELQRPIDAYQAAVVKGGSEEITRSRGSLRFALEDLVFTVTSEDVGRRARGAMVDYIGNAAKHGIKVVAADPADADPKTVNALVDFEKQATILDIQRLTNPASITEKSVRALKSLTKDAKTIVDIRTSASTNQSIADKIITENQENRGHIVVIFGTGHGAPLLAAFQNRGLAAQRVAIHTSADSLASDEQVLLQYKQTDKLDNNFLLDTGRFVDDPGVSMPAPARKTPSAPVVKHRR